MNVETIDSQIKKRTRFLVNTLINTSGLSNSLILTSSDDQGVIRNGGRRGSAWGAQAILAQFKKMIAPTQGEPITIKECSTKSIDSNLSQSEQKKKINQILNEKKYQNIIHLGGGHDHIFPFISSLLNTYSKIHIINIDAHLDTRRDQLFHSGTPFRQLANLSKKENFELRITQIGIHDYANLSDNYKGLSKLMSVVSIENFLNNTQRFLKNNEDFQLFLSIDVDGLHSSIMEATSAVNHNGIPGSQLEKLFKWYLNLKHNAIQTIGIYEYNPVFDNLSCKGARLLASMVYRFCFKLPDN